MFPSLVRLDLVLPPDRYLQGPRIPPSTDRELSQLLAIASRPKPRRRLRPLLRFAVRRAGRFAPPRASTSVRIRPATAGDGPELRRLAVLDERPLPVGDALVAEVDDQIVATISLESGEPIADPFRAPSDVVLLLELRAAQLAA